MIPRMHTVIPALFLILFLISVAVSASPGDAADLVAQGNELIKTKNYAGALAAYEQAISLDKNNFNAWNGKADALNRAGNFTEALAASDTALALEPSSTAGWINRGYILYNLGRYEDELRAYETAISLEPDNAEAWFNKGYSGLPEPCRQPSDCRTIAGCRYAPLRQVCSDNRRDPGTSCNHRGILALSKQKPCSVSQYGK